MKVEEILQKFNEQRDLSAIEGMTKYGITPEKAFGIKIPILRKMAKEIKKDRILAHKLWNLGYRETMILASMIDIPSEVTEEQLEKWVKDFTYWEICDQAIMNLFEKTKFAYEKAVEWSFKEEEFIKRAGFVMMARLAVSGKKSSDGMFERFFPRILEGCYDERNMVKKAVNWALRQIGKRNLELNRKAIKIADTMSEFDSKSAKWIATDAIRELKSDSVQKRLKK